MGADREIHKEFLAAVEADGDAPDTFARHYRGVYRDTQAMRIRRLMLSRSTDPRSLASLLTNLATHPGLIDRDRFVEMVEGPAGGDSDAWRSGTARHFDRAYGNEAGELDPKKLQVDLDRITSTCSEVTAFADSRIAHIDDTAADPTWSDIDRCVDLVEELFVKYALLLTGDGWILPPVIDPLWKRTFTKALFKPPGVRS